LPLASIVASVESIRAIHRSGAQLVMAITGGGSEAVASLLQVPGASRSMLEAVVPYSAKALACWLGGVPDHACSAATARAMAMAAFMRARQLAAPQTEPQRLVGISCTASLVSDRPKAGDHRIHVGVQTASATVVCSLCLEKGRRERLAEEAIARDLVLCAAAEACGVDAQPWQRSLAAACPAEPIDTQCETASHELADLILGVRHCVLLAPDHWDANVAAAKPPAAVFAGAFNPPHSGHLKMAADAERRLRRPLTWELSIANVDKPPLDFIAIRARVEGLKRSGGQRSVALTHAATFREKAELFPEATFVVGADTILRIADQRYYGGDEALRDVAIQEIAARRCRFLVYGRVVEGQFETLADLNMPPALAVLCDEVPASDFREDVSSTELRGAAGV
jgi:nicotinamide mononucleotide (NMN) deamidase PncC